MPCSTGDVANDPTVGGCACLTAGYCTLSVEVCLVPDSSDICLVSGKATAETLRPIIFLMMLIRGSFCWVVTMRGLWRGMVSTLRLRLGTWWVGCVRLWCRLFLVGVVFGRRSIVWVCRRLNGLRLVTMLLWRWIVMMML